MYQIYDTYISIKNRLDLFCHKVFWFQYRFLPTILIFSSEKNIEYKASPKMGIYQMYYLNMKTIQ